MRKKTKINKDLAEAPGGEGDGEEKKKSKLRVFIHFLLLLSQLAISCPTAYFDKSSTSKRASVQKGISFGVTEVAEIDEDGKVIKMGEMETKKGKRKKKKKDRKTPEGTVATTDIDAGQNKKKMTMAEYSKAMRKRTLEV